jgi:putative two-component system response regulator
MDILVVDDDPFAIALVRRALSGAGHTVHAATNGREALDFLRGASCRVVISDWDMPEMDGIELCRTLRREDFGGYIYTILLTGKGKHQQKLAALEAGADDFIPKPFDDAELVVRVRSAERILSIETRDLALFALAKLAESRDTDTGSHLDRVQRYSGLLARELAKTERHRGRIDAEYIRLIESTSALHDIGKVGIPDMVLLKPGRLSDREFEIMKTHVTLGAENLDAALRKFPTASFLRMARDIAASHHERFDGSGYPDRIAGDAIPLSARIVALADVYDALSTKRCYKAAFTHDIAKSIIVGDSGTHFDPDLVAAFLAAEAQFVAIHEQFADRAAAAAAA